MANIDDKFIKSVIAPPTKLSSSMSASSDVVAVESMDGWTSDTAVLAAIDRVDSLGNLTPDKMEIVLGVVSETGLSNVKRGIGGNVQSHSAGSVVELSIAGAEQWNRAMDALIGAFGQDGKLKESAFASGQQVVDGANIKDGSIEPVKLSTDMGVYSARTSSLSMPAQSVTQDLAGNGAKITLNLKKNTRVLVTVFVGMKSASDFEFKPAILVNGVEKYREEISASLATSGRAVQRSAQVAFDIPAGAQIISAGVWSQSATNQEVPAGAASISVIVFK